MLSRILTADGSPRERVFWLVLAAVALSQLLAFWALCNQQVQRAESRRAGIVAERVADCRATGADGTGCAQPILADASRSAR